MSIDTKGVVLTPCKDILLVSKVVCRALKQLLDEERKIEFSADPRSEEARNAYSTYVRCELSPESEIVTYDFVFATEQRHLKAFFTCDSDHADLAPLSISFMLGDWGSSPLLMQHVLFALSFMGETYYDESDCDSVGLAKCDTPKLNFLRAVYLGFVRDTELQDFVKAWDEGKLGKTTDSFEAFFGMTRARADNLLGMHYKTCWDETDKLAKAEGEAAGNLTPEYLLEHHQAMATKKAA